MTGNYIGNNPNGVDFVLSDEYKTNNPKIFASTACVNNAVNEIKGNAHLPLGHFFLHPFPTPPDGCLVVNGSEYNRELYKDLFADAVRKNYVKPESEWQSIAAANGGYCPWYSDGDGSTTFRTPKFAPYQKIALASGDAGKYYEAGLPNITGTFIEGRRNGDPSGSSVTGAFTYSGAYSTYAPSSDRDGFKITFDASVSNSIYGNSTTVTPESNDWIVCVVAFGTATNVGSVDVANVMSAVGQVQAEAIEIDSSGYSSSQHWVRYKDGRQIIYSDWLENISGTTTFVKPFSRHPSLIGYDNGTMAANTERRGKLSTMTTTYFTTSDWAYGSTSKTGCWVAMGLWK